MRRVWPLIGVIFCWLEAGATPPIGDVRAEIRAEFRRRYPRTVSGPGRYAHALPHKVSFRIQQRDQSDWSGTLYDDAGWRRTLEGGAQLTWQLEAEWDLARLLFHPEWERSLRQDRDWRRREEDAVELGTRLYYDRTRAVARLRLAPPLDPLVRAKLRLDIRELTARLDALTDGYFTGALGRRRAPQVQP